MPGTITRAPSSAGASQALRSARTTPSTATPGLSMCQAKRSPVPVVSGGTVVLQTVAPPARPGRDEHYGRERLRTGDLVQQDDLGDELQGDGHDPEGADVRVAQHVEEASGRPVCGPHGVGDITESVEVQAAGHPKSRR